MVEVDEESGPQETEKKKRKKMMKLGCCMNHALMEVSQEQSRY